MRYSRLGDSGLLVSSFCLGAPNLGTPTPQMAIAPHFNEKEAGELVASALDLGVNFLDTADLYSNGEAEEILGRVLGKRRRDVVIATKAGLRSGAPVTQAGLSRRHILMSVDDSLRRLGTDWLDVYILHRTDPHTRLEETLQALDDVVRAGKVRYIGYSNWPSWLAAKAVGLQRQNGWAKFVVAQMYYSLAGREIEYDHIPFAIDAGIGLMTWSPLANGFLTGKYSQGDPTGGGGRMSKFEFGPFDRAKGEAIVAVLRTLAERHGSTPAGVALAWLRLQPGVSTVMIGASRVTQVAENLSAAEVSLTAEDMEALAAVSACPEPYPNWYNTIMTDPVTRAALGG